MLIHKKTEVNWIFNFHTWADVRGYLLTDRQKSWNCAISLSDTPSQTCLLYKDVSAAAAAALFPVTTLTADSSGKSVHFLLCRSHSEVEELRGACSCRCARARACLSVRARELGRRREDTERLLSGSLVKLRFPASSVRNGSEQHLLLAVDVGDQYAARTALQTPCRCERSGGTFNLGGSFYVVKYKHMSATSGCSDIATRSRLCSSCCE